MHSLTKSRMSNFVFFVFFIISTINAQELKIDKKHFSPGEEIQVHFTASGNFADNAWIGIIPSNIQHGSETKNDQHDLTYQYLKKRTSGTLIFKAPKKEGAYDFRMNDTDSNGKEVASVSFNVGISKQLELDKKVFGPGEQVQVHFNAPSDFADNAWIGIIPSNVQHGSESENDKHDLSYQYLKKRTSGTLTFNAPKQEGAYDFRMHDTDSNGKEVASISFSVGTVIPSGSSKLKLDKKVFAPGEEIQVHFTASSNFADNAWVGIIPSSVQHGSEPENDKHDLSYQYLKKRTSGTLIFKAPANVGAYDFRMNDTDSNGHEVASVSFKVQK